MYTTIIYTWQSMLQLLLLACTVNLLLQQLKVKFAENAVLLIVRPIKIEGKATTKQFFKFVPPKE